MLTAFAGISAANGNDYAWLPLFVVEKTQLSLPRAPARYGLIEPWGATWEMVDSAACFAIADDPGRTRRGSGGI